MDAAEAATRFDRPAGAEESWQEYLTRDRPVTKLFLDRDVDFPPDAPPTAEDAERERRRVDERVADLVAKFADFGRTVACVVATRHGTKPNGSHKLSFRPFFSGLRVHYPDIPRILLELHQMDLDLPPDGQPFPPDDYLDFWDLSVYKPAEQLLAAIHPRHRPVRTQNSKGLRGTPEGRAAMDAADATTDSSRARCLLDIVQCARETPRDSARVQRDAPTRHGRRRVHD